LYGLNEPNSYYQFLIIHPNGEIGKWGPHPQPNSCWAM